MMVTRKSLDILAPFLIFILCLTSYLALASKFKFSFETHPANYFSHLSYSFLNLKLFLINPGWDHDLSLFNGKYYLYWGPTPVLLILPFVYLFGINVSDKLYTAFYASFSPLVFYFILGKLKNIGIVFNLSTIKRIFITSFFAFGTVHLYLSSDGGVWSTSQIFSTLYILISLFFMFKYLHNNHLLYLILGGIFFGLSFLGRLTFFIYIIPFLTFIFLRNFQNFKNKVFWKHLLIFISIISFFFIIEGIYNFVRFNSAFETGHIYHKAAGSFIEDRNNYGEFNIHYIARNLYYLFLNIPQPNNSFPFFNFSLTGNSIFFTSPLFLLALLIVKKEFWQGKNNILFNTSIIATIIVIIAFLSLYFSTGFIQFSYRYSLDFIPLLLLLLAQVISNTSIKILMPFYLLSLLINILGALWFLKILI